MRDPNDVNIPDLILEQLRCSICKGYLSCAPLRLLPDGSSICGNCSPSASVEPSYRILSLEAIVGHVAFPCKYRKYGCEECLFFGQVNQHECACSYRGFACPKAGCLWEGPVLQLPAHFANGHPDLIRPKAEFELSVAETKQEVVMLIIGGANLMVKYKYDAETHDFYYSIGYFTREIAEASCKIRLMNGSDHDYSVTAKGDACQPYDYNFYATQNSNVLVLNKFLPALNHPNHIVVAIDLMVAKSESNACDLLKCAACKENLLLPIFECNRGTVCTNCSHKFDDSRPSDNENVKQRIINATFSCRWKCEFTGKEDKIKTHERACKYRTYRCIIPNCEETFQLSRRCSHMDAHGYKHFSGNYDYTMKFSETGEKSYIYTVIDEEIIAIKTETYLCFNTNNGREYNVHRVTLIGTNVAHIRTSVGFRHFHCNRSSEFGVSSQSRISLDMLPDCFKPEDKLVVSICVNFAGE